MILLRRFASVLLVPALALPAAAQRLAPLGPRAADASPASRGADTPGAAARGTTRAPDPGFDRTRTIIGGVVGGAAGAAIGLWIAGDVNRDCGGDLCGLPEAAAGFLIGESLGLAIGAHVGARSTHHGRLALTALSSAGILVGGVLVGAVTGPVGLIMIPLTPALQLAAAAAIESR